MINGPEVPSNSKAEPHGSDGADVQRAMPTRPLLRRHVPTLPNPQVIAAPSVPAPRAAASQRGGAEAPAALPSLNSLALPGLRRAVEKRGSATATDVTLWLLIRCPLLHTLATAIPRTATGGRGWPPVFYLVLAALAREVKSYDQAEQDMHTHRRMVRAEFAALGIDLPAKANDALAGYGDFSKWRKKNVLGKPAVLLRLQLALPWVALPLSLAIREAETGTTEPGSFTNPGRHDELACDGTVFDAPSDVRLVPDPEAPGALRLVGSRANKPEHARVHHAVTGDTLRIKKPHGATRGLYYVVATTRGADSYTRVAVGADIARPNDNLSGFEGEDAIALRVLGQVFFAGPDQFRVLLYDGLFKQGRQNHFSQRHGVFTVNLTQARRNTSKREEVHILDPDTGLPRYDTNVLGQRRRSFGKRKGQDMPTQVLGLPKLDCAGGDHYLAADAGAVYETDVDFHSGATVIRKLALLDRGEVLRLRDENGYYFRVQLHLPCRHGHGVHTTGYDLKGKLDKRGSMRYSHLAAAIRVLPDAYDEEFRSRAGRRNQIEGFFSWLEECFRFKDRAMSWGRDAQLFDLIAACALHNAEAHAHLMARHPQIAQTLQMPDLDQVLPLHSIQPPAPADTSAIHSDTHANTDDAE